MDDLIKYNKVQITYDIDLLFKQVQAKSVYLAHSVPAQNTQEKQFAITENERDFFEMELRYAADILYNALYSATKQVDDSYSYNQIDPANNNRRLIIYQLKLPENYNLVGVKMIHSSGERVLISQILFVWFRNCGVAQAASACFSDLNEGLSSVTSSIIKRKLSISRPQSIF